MRRAVPDIDEVGPGVFSVRTPLVNWYLLREGRDLTLVDGGYPGDAADVLSSIERIGHHRGDVRAVLVTHAHVDHIGGLGPLLQHAPAPEVLLDPAEVAHAHREHLQQVSVGTVLAHAWRPRIAVWAARVVRRGGTQHAQLPTATAFPTFPALTPTSGPVPGGAVAAAPALDVPGRPVPVPTHGHTSGHSAFLLPDSGIVVSGDALVTAHPTSAVRGPQLLPGFFHHDVSAATAALRTLAQLDADVVLPGHGPVLHVPLGDAVDRALRGVRRRPGAPRRV